MADTFWAGLLHLLRIPHALREIFRAHTGTSDASSEVLSDNHVFPIHAEVSKHQFVAEISNFTLRNHTQRCTMSGKQIPSSGNAHPEFPECMVIVLNERKKSGFCLKPDFWHKI